MSGLRQSGPLGGMPLFNGLTANQMSRLGALLRHQSFPANTNIISIAADVLEGRAAMLGGDAERAAKAFGSAAALQEKIFATSFDPPP